MVFSAGALDALPAAPSDGHRCFDANNDGVIDLATECSGWHERVLPVPSEASRRPDVPFKWALLNWNPRRHIPLGVFDTPHFDVHFYIEPIENIFAIQRGTCGAEKSFYKIRKALRKLSDTKPCKSLCFSNKHYPFSENT